MTFRYFRKDSRPSTPIGGSKPEESPVDPDTPSVTGGAVSWVGGGAALRVEPLMHLSHVTIEYNPMKQPEIPARILSNM